MALVPLPPTLSSEPKTKNHFENFTSHLKPFSKTQNISRRRVAISTLFPTLLYSKSAVLLVAQPANALDLRMTTPDQTVEEAENGINGHVESLLQVKDLFESQPPDTWKEARKALRKRASYLKQDIYTIIQSKPGGERPMLRKLYSSLFNSVTAMDFAARDKDATRVWECYAVIVSSLNEILARI